MVVVVAASNGGVAILALLVLVPLGLLSVFKPRESWRTFESWKYKNPDANEPSDTEYGLRQIGGVATIVIAIIVVIAAASSGGDESESNSGVDINYLLERSRERARTTAVPEDQVLPPWMRTTTTERQTRITDTPTTSQQTSTPIASTTEGTGTTEPAITESLVTLESEPTDKTVTGSLTVSNPDSTDKTVDRYLVVTDREGRVVTRMPISVEVSAGSSVDLDPTPFLDLDLMEDGTYYWSISETAAGSTPINSGIFAVSTVPRQR